LEIQTGCSDYSLLDIVELLLSFVYWRNVLLLGKQYRGATGVFKY